MQGVADEPLTEEIDEPLVKYGDEYEINVAKENKDVILENLRIFRSILFLKPDNAFRRLCIKLTGAWQYNLSILLLICASVSLGIWADESRRARYPETSYFIEIFQQVLLGVFFADVTFHIVADGIIMLPKSYLRNTWNALDLGLLIAQALVLVAMPVGGQRASFLRAFRTLRSMRIVYYIEGMRVIYLDLLYGLPTMFNAVLLNFIVFVVFAIYGCILFSGKFLHCNDDQVSGVTDCHGEYHSVNDDAPGIFMPRVWKNPYSYSYDYFGNALLHLFECASGEGWVHTNILTRRTVLMSLFRLSLFSVL